MTRRLLLPSMLCLGVLVGGTARADDAASPVDQQLAQNLFDDGRRLMEQGDYAHACAKLAESQRLDPGGGTLLNLAICHEKEGKLASAFAELNASVSLAIRDKRNDRLEIARARLAAISSDVSHLTVDVASSATSIEGLEVRLDGALLSSATWGTPLGVDPGAHRVQASAPGRRGWEVTVNFDRRGQNERVEIPALSSESGVSVGCPAGTVLHGTSCDPAPSAPFVVSPSEPPPTYRTRPSVLFWSVAGVTVAAFVTSTVTGVVAINAHSSFQSACPNLDRHYCTDPQTASDAADRGRLFAWVSSVSLGVGVVAGGALFFIPARDKIPVTPKVGFAPGGASVALEGKLP